MITTLTSLVLLGGTGYWQREFLTAHYHAWRLPSATPDQLPSYVRKFEALGMPGAEALVSLFKSNDSLACNNAGSVLGSILQIWVDQTDRREAVLQLISQNAADYSPYGTASCLKVMEAMLNEGTVAPSAVNTMMQLISQSKEQSAASVSQCQILHLLLNQDRDRNENVVSAARACVLKCLRDNDPAVRQAGIRLAVHPALLMHDQLATLVSAQSTDSNPTVRQLAILALGEYDKLLSTDELCRFLLDPDTDVRTMTQRALRLRGLSARQITLAGMIQDPSPSLRAELPMIVMDSTEIDTHQWMERLCRDKSPAVRAAAAKALSATTEERLQTLKQQLCELDEDDTVRRIAQFYLKQ